MPVDQDRGSRREPRLELIEPLLAAADEAGLALGLAESEPGPSRAGLQLFPAAGLPEPNPLWPLVVFGLERPGAAAEAAAVLSRQYPPQHPILVQRAPDGTTLHELRRLETLGPTDRGEPATVYVPPLAAEQALASPFALRALIHRLRAPGGCPWDRAQTPASLLRFVLEEAYEVADAIEHGTAEERCEELGDLLLQVYLQAEIAEERGDFDLTEVVRGLAEKLIRRHPHVFGSAKAADAAEVELNWEQLKAAERKRPTSVLERIPRSLPALARAAEIQRRLSKAGFDWPSPDGAWAKLDEELGELRAAVGDRAATEAELGDLLFMLVKIGRQAGVDSEVALRGTIERVTGRYHYLERTAAARGAQVGDLPIEDQLDLWQEAKRSARAEPSEAPSEE